MPGLLVGRASFSRGVRGRWPRDGSPLPTQDDEPFSGGRIAIVGCRDDLPIHMVVQRAQGFEEGLEKPAFLALERFSIAAQRPPALELRHILDYYVLHWNRFRPTEHMPGRGAGLFAAWFAPAGIAVMRAFRAGSQQMKSLYQSARVKVIQ